jgi:hypothetical protein
MRTSTATRSATWQTCRRRQLPPIDEYISDSMVGSDNDASASSRRVPSKVAASRRTRQTTGKIHASQVATQVAEVKKRRGEAD